MLNTTSFYRVASISNGHAVAGWISTSNSSPYSSKAYVSYYNGTTWQSALDTSTIVTSPSEVHTDSIAVSINTNNHAVAVWASSQFNSEGSVGYGLSSIQTTNATAWTAVANTSGIIPQTVRLAANAQTPYIALNFK